MNWFSIAILLDITAILIFLWGLRNIWMQRNLPGWRTALMLLTASTLWLLSITNEIFSPSVKVQLQWLRIEWLCWSIVPTLLIIYGLLYNEWVNRFKWWQLLLISTVPIAVFSLYLTHDRHGLIYENF